MLSSLCEEPENHSPPPERSDGGGHDPKTKERTVTTKTYIIPIYWRVGATLHIEAKSKGEAIVKAQDTHVDTVEDSYYIEDSLKVRETGISYQMTCSVKK